jgi:hypothetical protein
MATALKTSGQKKKEQTGLTGFFRIGNQDDDPRSSDPENPVNPV